MHELSELAPSLVHLAAVARTEHLTRAADSLGVSQSTLSRSMARLTERVGAPMLVPDGRGVRLTRAGRLLAEHAARAEAELQAGLDGVRAEVSPQTGRVVFGFQQSFGPVAVPRLLHGFRARHPALRVQLVQGGTDPLTAAVVNGEVDVALVSPPPPDPRLGVRELARQDLVLLVPPEHRLAVTAARRRRAPVSVDQLGDEPVVTMQTGFGLRALTDELLHASGQVRYAFEAEDLATLAGLVAAGLGVAIVPQGTAPDPSVGPTVELRLTDPAAQRTVAAVWAADRTPTTPAAQLRRYLTQHGRTALRGS